MDDVHSAPGELPSAPPAVAERIADETVAPGADELTVQMPGRQAKVSEAESKGAAAEKVAEMAMPAASSAPGTLPADEPAVPALSGHPVPPAPYLAPGMPTYAPAAGTVPTLPVVAPPGYSAAFSPARRNPSPLGQPFPPAVTALLGVAAFAAVALAYGLAELVARADWADGARVAGAAALILAGASLLVASLRVAQGRRALGMIVLAVLLAATLGVGGGGAVVASPALHRAQARSLERDHAWDAAIAEYKRAGERPPNATDIARVLVESGEAQAAGGHYARAVAAFQVVTAQYASSDAAMVDRAYKDAFQTYAAWVRANRPDVPYADAASFFSTYRDRPTCDASCKQDATAIEAQTRYQYGQALAAAKRYSDAVAQFEQVTGPLSGSAYAPKAHAAAATAYLTLGKQKLQQECPAPVPADQPPTESLAIYQKLATAYVDTPEGQQAKAALAAPQTVTGYLYHPKTSPAPTLYLSKTINPNAYAFSDDYTAAYDPSSGLFTFKNVAQGTYYLNAVRNDGSYIHYIWYEAPGNTGPGVHVGPLCGTDWGTDFYNEK